MKENEFKFMIKTEHFDRKLIVKAIGEAFQIKPKYLGAPSFNYEIKLHEGKVFTIDPDGVILTPSYDINEFYEIAKVYEILKNIEVVFKSISIKITIKGHTGLTLKNLINMIASKQKLIKKSLAIDIELIGKDLIKKINAFKEEEIEGFKRAILELGEYEEQLIKFNFQEEVLEFRNFNNINELSDLEAYIQLINALNNAAKTIKYCSSKETLTDNEKYTFRTWLLRLGFIGERYKSSRNQLLRNLSGNSAFRRKIS